MRVIIVDDDVTKVNEIVKVLNEFKEKGEMIYTHFTNVADAKREMKDVGFDLMILDLNLPKALGMDINEKEGHAFLEEIISIDSIKKPSNIVILSAYEKLIDGLVNIETSSHFNQLKYDILDNTWRQTLSDQVSYIQCAEDGVQTATVHDDYFYDIAIISAVDVEDKNIACFSDSWESITVKNDPTVYKVTEIILNGKKRKLVRAMQNEMGVTAASVLSGKLISLFRPKYLFMLGIAAGIDRDNNLGDILVASDIWTYNTGKYAIDSTGVEQFKPDPKYIQVKNKYLERIKDIDNSVLNNIQEGFSQKVNSKLRLLLGPIACGAAVVANGSFIDEYVTSKARKTLGLDMESYGVAYSCVNYFGVTPDFFVVKSICDFADEEKDDSMQDYAAYTSVEIGKYIINNILEF